MDPHRVGRTIAGMGFINFITLVLSLIQAIIVARAFGTGESYDLYLLAIAIPEVIVYLATEVINASLVPSITYHTRKGDRESAYRVGFSFFASVLLSASFLLLILELISPYLCNLLGGDAVNHRNLLIIVRLIMPLMVVYIAHRVIATMHNAIESFILPSIASVFPPIIISISVLLLTNRFDIYSLVIGIFVSALSQIVFLTPLLLREGWGYIKVSGVDLRKGFSVCLVGMTFIIGAIAERMNLLVDRAVASHLQVGSISALKYGFQIVAYLQAMFSVPLNRVYYTQISQDIGAGNINSALNRFDRGARTLAIVYIPVGLLMTLIAHPVIRVLFQRGSFTELSTTMSAKALSIYAPGLIFIGLVSLTSSMIYALKKSLAYSLVGALIIALNLILDITLVRYIEYLGIAITTVIVNAVWSFTFVFYIGRLLSRNLFSRGLLLTFLKVSVSSGIAYLLLWFAMKNVAMPSGFLPQVFYILVVVFLFIAVSWGLAYLFGEKMVKDIMRLRF